MEPVEGKRFLLHDIKATNTLRFCGDKIEFSDRTVKIMGFPINEFLEQFDSLVFVDKTGRTVIFKKEKKKESKGGRMPIRGAGTA